jgi:Uncharacterised protein family (UPF0014)
METPEQVLLSLGFILGAIGLSLWQRLDLVGPIIVATGRSILQMIVFCYLLAVIFAAQTPVVTAIAAVGLILVSSLLLHHQINERVPFLWPMLSGSLLLSSILTLGYTQIFITPTWGALQPQAVLPFLGMLLSSMSASSLATTQLIKTLNTRRLEIETHLSLGASNQHFNGAGLGRFAHFYVRAINRRQWNSGAASRGLSTFSPIYVTLRNIVNNSINNDRGFTTVFDKSGSIRHLVSHSRAKAAV